MMIKATALSIVVLALARQVYPSRSFETQTGHVPDKSQILDMHCHVAGIGAGDSGAFLSDKMRNNWRYKIYLRAFSVTEEDVIRHGDALIIQKISEKLNTSEHVGAAVLLALDGVIDKDGSLDRQLTETYIPNNFLAAEVAKYGNLYFGASVNPYRKDALERLDQAKADRAVLIKWLPAIQHIDPADNRLVPFYKKLVELDLPLLTHAGNEDAFTRADNSLGDPQKLHLPLRHGVQVIVAHAATTGKSEGQDNMQRLLPMFAQYSNLYTDISALTQVNKLRFLPKLLASGIDPQKILYGTDFPLIKTGLTSPIFSAFNIGPKKVAGLARIKNPWDQDIQLKLAHGVPAQIFSNTQRILIK